MNEYTTNQPIGSTVSNHDITHRLHNGKCLDCDECSYCKENYTRGNVHFCRQKAEDVRDKAIVHELQKQMAENCGAHALTPLGEALQTNCPRCNMRWIVHNCPQYPKLLDAKEMIKKLARGAVLQELAENADYFTSIKQDGEEFNVYVRENNKI